jgi:cyclophilin family peptidyl-prolyl cis-trans isomerase
MSFDAPFELALTEGATYTATIETSCGTIVLELDPVNAPTTTNNFVELARAGYFDGLTFHRAVPGFVIQGGDPLGNGTGGPGYSFEDELPSNGYALGDVAMANAGPDTNGSQFFIVTGDASFLSNDFSKFGRVTEGLEVAQTIESFGDPSTQVMIAPIYTYSVTITES